MFALVRLVVKVTIAFALYWYGYSHLGPTPKEILTNTTSAAVKTYVAAEPYVIVGKDIVVRVINKELENLGEAKNPVDGTTE